MFKDVSPEDLVQAISVAARGDAVIAPALTRRLLEHFVAVPPPGQISRELAGLGDREVQILRQVARGRSNAQIAKALFLSEATVKTYISRLLTKLRLRDRVQLAVLAYESGLVRAGGPR